MPCAALFVVDIQHCLALNPRTRIPHAQRILTAGTTVLQHARSRIDSARSAGKTPDFEIVIVQHEEAPEKGPLQRGSEAWELAFPPRENDGYENLVSKSVRDTFQSNPRLASQLRARGVDTIVAFGIQSECCVLSTCLGALAAEFKVVLLTGAHSTYDGEGKTAVEIEREVESTLKKKGAEVVRWEEWMKELKQEACDDSVVVKSEDIPDDKDEHSREPSTG